MASAQAPTSARILALVAAAAASSIVAGTADVSAAAAGAAAALSAAGVVAAETLALIYVHTDRSRDALLGCSISLARAKLSATRTVAYVFYRGTAPDLPTGADAVAMEISDDAWVAPAFARVRGGDHPSGDYRLMGLWRLDFAPRFASAVGHPSWLQIDDDLFMVGDPLTFDVVAAMRTHDVGNYCDLCFRDAPFVSTGLPELTRYWLATRRASVVGPLFDHCLPPDESGLYNAREGERGGWDRAQSAGHLFLYSTAWAMRDDVRDFVELVLRTGSAYEVCVRASKLARPLARQRSRARARRSGGMSRTPCPWLGKFSYRTRAR